MNLQQLQARNCEQGEFICDKAYLFQGAVHLGLIPKSNFKHMLPVPVSWETGVANLFRAFWTERNGEIQLVTNSLVNGEMKGRWQVSKGWLAFPLKNTKDKEVHERLRVSMTEVVQTSPFWTVALHSSPWSWEECSSPWENRLGGHPISQPVPPADS